MFRVCLGYDWLMIRGSFGYMDLWYYGMIVIRLGWGIFTGFV